MRYRCKRGDVYYLSLIHIFAAAVVDKKDAAFRSDFFRLLKRVKLFGKTPGGFGKNLFFIVTGNHQVKSCHCPVSYTHLSP